MYVIKKVIRVLYGRLIELFRTIFNKTFYSIFNIIIKLFNMNNIKVYSDSNGWFITYKYNNYIYKVVAPFVFLRMNFSLKALRLNLINLKKNTLYKNNIPEFSLHLFYIKFKFIDMSISLDQYLINIDSSKEKIIFFHKLLDALDDFHQLGFTHGDLKPKNILVSDENIYFIDLENIREIKNNDDKLDDYNKLFPRIIYYLNNEELLNVINLISSQNIVTYIEKKYLIKYNILEYLQKVPNIIFEQENYSEYEDIDIEVPSMKYFYNTLREFKSLNLDNSVFYCGRNDMKVYLYNQSFLTVVDVHLTNHISKTHLFYLKIFKNKVKNIFITGPDGIGKTTILNNVVNIKNQFMYKIFNLELKHGNRFIKNQSVIKDSKLERFILCRAFGCILKKNLLLLRFKYTSKSVITIFDRSFIDIFIHTKLSIIKKILIHVFGNRKDIVLLKDNSANILKRKEELTLLQIENYYKNFEYIKSDICNIDVRSIEITAYKIDSYIRYKLLTTNK
jgi:hypothetical protein